MSLFAYLLMYLILLIIAIVIIIIIIIIIIFSFEKYSKNTFFTEHLRATPRVTYCVLLTYWINR